jgi:hypothetical protein
MRHGEVSILTAAERFELFLRLLAPEDYEFIRAKDPGIEKRFRRDRSRVFRAELFALCGETGGAYRLRMSRIHRASLYGKIAPLMWDTAMAYGALGKLSIAAALFFYGVPWTMRLRPTADRLLRYLTVETLSAESLNQSVNQPA